MSFDDIKEKYTNYEIDGEVYKIAYDFHAIIKLEELYDKKYFELGSFLEDLTKQDIKKLVEFCHIGFLKYQPNFELDKLKEVTGINQLIDICFNEYIRAVATPDVYAQYVDIEQSKSEDVKKNLSLLKSLISFMSLKLNLTTQK